MAAACPAAKHDLLADWGQRGSTDWIKSRKAASEKALAEIRHKLVRTLDNTGENLMYIHLVKTSA